MNGKRPLALLMVAVLAIGLVGVFATPVAAGGDDTECNAEASNEANQAQNAVGAYIDQDQMANQNAEASINNNAVVNQFNEQNTWQEATGGNVAQSSNQAASNTAYVDQC